MLELQCPLAKSSAVPEQKSTRAWRYYYWCSLPCEEMSQVWLRRPSFLQNTMRKIHSGQLVKAPLSSQWINMGSDFQTDVLYDLRVSVHVYLCDRLRDVPCQFARFAFGHKENRNVYIFKGSIFGCLSRRRVRNWSVHHLGPVRRTHWGHLASQWVPYKWSQSFADRLLY